MLNRLFILCFLFSPLFAQHLYVIHGRSGEIDAKNQTFLMQDVDHSVVYFSVEGERRAGTLKIKEFLELWALGKVFGLAPPQAFFIAYHGDETEYNPVPLKLTRPRYNREEAKLIFVVDQKIEKSESFGEVALYLIHE